MIEPASETKLDRTISISTQILKRGRCAIFADIISCAIEVHSNHGLDIHCHRSDHCDRSDRLFLRHRYPSQNVGSQSRNRDVDRVVIRICIAIPCITATNLAARRNKRKARGRETFSEPAFESKMLLLCRQRDVHTVDDSQPDVTTQSFANNITCRCDHSIASHRPVGASRNKNVTTSCDIAV